MLPKARLHSKHPLAAAFGAFPSCGNTYSPSNRLSFQIITQSIQSFSKVSMQQAPPGSPHNTFLLTILAVGLGVLAVYLVLRCTFNVLREKLRNEIRKRFPAHEILKATLAANSFGVQSLGKWQVRGNGALLLLQNMLFFRMIVPHREVTIPLQAIQNVSLCNGFMGKATSRPLLRVDFSTPAGPDAAAFSIHEPELWLQAINNARQSVPANKDSSP